MKDTFTLTQPKQNIFEPTTSSFTDFFFAPFSTNFFESQPFDATEDHLHPNISTPTLESSSSTRPNEPNFTTKPNLPNGELSPFSEDEDEKDDEEEAQSVSPITIVPPYYISPLMQNFEESYFQDFEYEHSLDCKEVQHPVGTLFKRMCFLTKQDVQNALLQYHVSKWTNYKTQLSNPKKWEIRKLHEPHTCSSPSISQDHAKLSYLLISKSIHSLIENNPSTLVPTLIAHIKSTEGYTTTYLQQLRKIVPRSTEIAASYASISSWYGGEEGKHCNATTKRSTSKGFRHVPSSFLEFQTMYRWISILLYSKYKGTLLVAVAQDDNNKIFLIAFAVVENKHKSIKSVYSKCDSGWTTKNPVHLFCVRHIAQNYMRRYKSNPPKINYQYGMLITTHHMQRWTQMLIEQLIGLVRFYEKNRLLHGMGHMTTNLVESINLVLKKSRNMLIGALVKPTFVRCNALFNKKGREVTTILASGQVYKEVQNKIIEDALRKENTHNFIEFDLHNTRFLVQETTNLREVRLTGDFKVKLDERWCDCDKFQKLHMPCSHVVATCKHTHHGHNNYIHPMYRLESVCNIYKTLFGELRNETYWSSCHEPMISPNP
ncbi:hypothetical protein HKD37_04G009913 [Glycine soja]